MLTAAMASDRKPDDSRDEDRDDSNAVELKSESESAQDKPSASASSSPSPAASPTRRTKPRQVIIEEELDEDEDEDDEADEDEEEEERRRRARRARAKRQAARRRFPKKKKNIPTTEEQLNVPKLQTIGMLSSISVLVIIMWFAARLACNAHPDHIRDPRYVSVAQLARDPKNAGLEFQLRFASKDVILAGEIATGAMGDKIRELIQACERNPDVCERDRAALKNKITGTASLLEMNSKHAIVEVTTYTSNEDPHSVVLELVPDGQVWKVTQSRESEKKVPVAATLTEPVSIQQDAGATASP